jgi:hypothetical protein
VYTGVWCEINFTVEYFPFDVRIVTSCRYSIAGHCSALPEVANAETDNRNSQYGSQVNFTCKIGYLFPDNSTRTNITCMQDGSWTLGIGEISDCESTYDL